jgi:predicted Fe-Mo cluster-binding NifX family protein
MTTAGMPSAGPSSIPPGGTATAGATMDGAPSNIPPGQPSTTLDGSLSTTPQGAAPTQMGMQPGQMTARSNVTGGKPDAIPPMGQPQGSTMTANAQTTLPGFRPTTSAPTPQMPVAPMGQATAGTSAYVYSGTIPGLALMNTAGSSSPLPGVLQGTVDGVCFCPRCGRTVPHVRGTPCSSIACPSCGTPMVPDASTFSNLRTSLVSGTPSVDAVTIAGVDAGKICLATTGPTMESDIAPFFDRAPYFIIAGLGGVGVQSAQLIVSEGAKKVITNDISVTALKELTTLGVRVYPGVSATAAQALEWYENGRLTPASFTATSSDQEEDEHEQHGSSSSGKSKGKSQEL